MDKECLICKKMFHAKRSTAKYCSDACKLKNSRQINEDPVIVKKAPKKLIVCPKCNYSGYDSSNEWSHSACFKTQEEIESHYTLENFPNHTRYYSANGGGAGRLSPYNQTDPRYKAYTV